MNKAVILVVQTKPWLISLHYSGLSLDLKKFENGKNNVLNVDEETHKLRKK